LGNGLKLAILVIAVAIFLISSNIVYGESALTLNVGPYVEHGEWIKISGTVNFENGYAIGTKSPRGLPVAIEIRNLDYNVVAAASVQLENNKFSYQIPTADDPDFAKGGKYTVIAYYGLASATLLGTPNSISKTFMLTKPLDSISPEVVAPSNQANQPDSSNQNSENNSSQGIIVYALGIILLIIVIAIIPVVVSGRKRSSETYRPIVHSHDSSSRKDSKVALGSGRDNERKKPRNIKRIISNSAKNSADFKKESSDPRKRYGQRRKRKK